MNDDMALPMALDQGGLGHPPPNLDEWRKKLFEVEGTIVLSEGE